MVVYKADVNKNTFLSRAERETRRRRAFGLTFTLAPLVEAQELLTWWWSINNAFLFTMTFLLRKMALSQNYPFQYLIKMNNGPKIGLIFCKKNIKLLIYLLVCLFIFYVNTNIYLIFFKNVFNIYLKLLLILNKPNCL